MIQDDGRYPLESAVGDQHLAELIDLLEGSDTCELKLTVPDSEIGSGEGRSGSMCSRVRFERSYSLTPLTFVQRVSW